MEKDSRLKLLGGRDTSLPFTLNALQVVSKRYLLRTHEGQIIETPEEMFERVAKALAKVEEDYGAHTEYKDILKRDFYDIMANFEFTPAGRTLANAGGPTRLISNCIVLHIKDSMEDIYETLKDAALLQKAGSGLGFPLHLMRPAGAKTRESFGIASGPISFLQVYNVAFGVIKQQNRHGANMAVMRVDHPDILEFIHCKDREGDLRNFNVSVGLTNEFMKRVRDNDPNPWMCTFNGVQTKPRRVHRDSGFSYLGATEVTMTAREMFMEIISSSWKTGEPGCVFLDTVNETNPLPDLGQIEACNPCGEQFLHDGDVCNLGSINLEKFVTNGSVDYEKLSRVTKTAVHMLDNVIDLSDFPVQKVNAVFRGNRRIGLGIMGFADMLYQLGIGYNTKEGRDIAENVMRCISQSGSAKSVELGERKGVFPNWSKSVFAKSGEKRRNAAITNVPPTGTISMMFDVSGGVEPYFALAYYYKGILGDNSIRLSYVNKHLKAALEKHEQFTPEIMDQIINAGSVQNVESVHPEVKKVFVTSMDISAEDHILMQAAFQKYCDNAISKTINFPNSATREDILTGYIRAWETGCKGCTVYRDGSRNEQVLNLHKDDKAGTVPAAVTIGKETIVTTTTTSNPSSVAIASEASHSDPGFVRKRVLASDEKESCPDCQTAMTVQEGCSVCKNCGFSKCNL